MASHAPAGISAELVADLRRALGPMHRFSLDPLAADRAAFVPDVCAPVVPLRDTSVAEHIDAVRALPDEALQAELCGQFNGRVPSEWVAAVESPRRWRHSWATTSALTWTVLAPQWKFASKLIDREANRAGVGMLRGGVDVLLNTLHPRLRYRNGELLYRSHVGGVFTLSDRRLVLVPMIGINSAVTVSFDQPRVAYVAYSIPRFDPQQARSRDDALDLMLGAVRGGILRALGRPHSIGQLAATHNVALSTMSYHCDLLQRAGVLQRCRQGRSVLVYRTQRGDELVDVMSR